MEFDVVEGGFAVDIEIPAAAPVASLALAVVPGAAGPTGLTGATGPSGPSFDGVAWWYGDGAPSVVVGSKPGDFYMDLLTGNIHKLGD